MGVVLGVGQIGLVAAGSPNEELALAFIGRDAVHAQKVDDVLWLHTVAVSTVDLSEDLLLVEITRLDESRPLVLELHDGGGTSSCE